MTISLITRGCATAAIFTASWTLKGLTKSKTGSTLTFKLVPCFNSGSGHLGISSELTLAMNSMSSIIHH